MSKSNIFDLSNKFINNKKQKNREEVVNNEDIIKISDGIKLIEKSQWNTIPNNTFIRYQKKDGTYNKGSYILYQWDKIEDNVDKKYFKISKYPSNNNLSKKYSWGLSYDNINKLWVQPQPNIQQPQPNIQQPLNIQQHQPNIQQPSIIQPLNIQPLTIQQPQPNIQQPSIIQPLTIQPIEINNKTNLRIEKLEKNVIILNKNIEILSEYIKKIINTISN